MPKKFDYLTSSEAAEALGVTKGTLMTWRYLRKGPRYYKVGSKVLYRPSDIEDWLERNVVETEPCHASSRRAPVAGERRSR